MDEVVDAGALRNFRAQAGRLHGNYTAYLEQREARYEQQLAAYKNQQKEIATCRNSPTASAPFPPRRRRRRASSSRSSAWNSSRSRSRRASRSVFQIPPPPRGGQRAMTLVGIHMAYGDEQSLSGLDLTIERGERTVLVGPNGAGKSTLLKILAGVVEFQKGERDLGHNAKIGYFSQHRAATLDPEKTVLEEVLASAPGMREDEARGVLGSFMFRKDDIYKKT
jgi:ATP-binding cassette subfamily F protein 3